LENTFIKEILYVNAWTTCEYALVSEFVRSCLGDVVVSRVFADSHWKARTYSTHHRQTCSHRASACEATERDNVTALLSVRPSVRLKHSGVVSKRLNLLSLGRFVHHSSFLATKRYKTLTELHCRVTDTYLYMEVNAWSKL